MDEPYRFQLKRAAGWRKPPDGIACGRPGRWSNPYLVGQPLPPKGLLPWLDYEVVTEDQRLDFPLAVRCFEHDLLAGRTVGIVTVTATEVIAELGGHPLGCWCPEAAQCHVNVLIRVANHLPDDAPVPFRNPPWEVTP